MSYQQGEGFIQESSLPSKDDIEYAAMLEALSDVPEAVWEGDY